uniref:WW domain-containing protein n=1 Tax=Arundo donax TaxID=35708 RepID=A0A0A9GL88_ARUDO
MATITQFSGPTPQPPRYPMMHYGASPEQCAICEMWNSEWYDETGECYIVPMDNETQSDWKRWTTAVGQMCYYNIKTGQSTWEKPAELMTPLEKADASTEWTEYCTPEALRYYYNKVTKQSQWLIPDELQAARELAVKAENEHDGETRKTAGAIVSSTSVDLELGDEDDENKETKQEYTLLCEWVKQQLGDKVVKVQISKRSSSPCVLVSGKFGWFANMERLCC